MSNKTKGDIMKIILRTAVVLIAAISFVACQKADNPVAPSPLNKTSTINSTVSTNNLYNKSENLDLGRLNLSGTFVIYPPEMPNSDVTATMIGHISFYFNNAESTYDYSGIFDNQESDLQPKVISNSGKFRRKGDYIYLTDDILTGLHPDQTGLFLNGQYSYTERGNLVIIEGQSKMGHIRIEFDQ